MKNYLLVLALCCIALQITAQRDRSYSDEYPNKAGIKNATTIDDEYHTYLEVYSFLDSIVSLYPEITSMDTSGRSSVHQLKIPVLKISDNPDIEEDEPAINFDGHMHARELIGMETCLKLIDYLLTNYGTDPEVTFWVENAEIFIIPMLNPDGWKYITDENLESPYWRKNLRDNNNNGVMDHNYDGVDLNRNFDIFWDQGNDNPGSHYYSGPAAFSENESQLKRDWARQQKYVFSANYHSAGEVIIFGSTHNSTLIPDLELVMHVGNELASSIPKYGYPESYDLYISECDMGYSDCWMYQALGTIEFCVETSPVSVPIGPVGMQIAEDNLNGALYLLRRTFGPGITGHVRDGLTGEPISAWIKIPELYDAIIEPRMNDSLYGRFFRPLMPGEYTVEILGDTATYAVFEDVVVEDTLVYLDVRLFPTSGEHLYQGIGSITNTMIYPNPVDKQMNVYFEMTNNSAMGIEIFSMNGLLVKSWRNSKQCNGKLTIDMSDVSSGIYTCRISAGNYVKVHKIVKL